MPMLPILRKDTFLNKFDSIFDEIFNELFVDDFALLPMRKINLLPQYDFYENDNEYNIEVALAGVKKDDIKLSLTDNKLSVRVEEKNKEEDANRRRLFYGKYEKTFTVPNNIDVDKINASYENGILKIVLPKLENENKNTRNIEIA